ncbi:hypothetical protein Dsin_006550 [Dipteronia sinensis]|uniref:Beta-galactosidase n=1 Tax=Dipteronia sinensis TaxID=43782 RepID=A0AAE0EFP0_9ROSI|nr:hypothetical protein Dsin_006550 [Dipteronia sinensis]
MARPSYCVLMLCFAALLFGSLSSATDISFDGRGLKIDGERTLILSGSIHYPRSTPEMWLDLIKKAKEGGINAIETYVFWDAHEPMPRQYDFSGNLDLVRFIKTIQNEGLYAILRIGPYVCAEWNYGGLPVWLNQIPNITFRTNNEAFKHEMKNFTTFIVNMMNHENLFASQGGPIILAQIENEFGLVKQGHYGQDGKDYVQWCADLALSFDVGVPWIMCNQGDAPQPIINTCNGFYCDQSKPNNENSPKMWTENWTGWFQGWGGSRPHRDVKDVAFAVGRFFQYGGSLMNYYMYHGGTNFGHTSGGPYITTSYDYDAPLDEYGNLQQPKWGHLRNLHLILLSVQKTLLYGYKRDIDYGNMMSATVYNYEGKCVAFLGNANKLEDLTINFQDNNYTVPRWSVTVLPDCFTEAYNTAKINSQTSIMVNRPNQADDGSEPYKLLWVWRREIIEDIMKNGLVRDSVITTNKLLDHLSVTNDTSDYLWYMTRLDVNPGDPFCDKTVTLHVHTYGHVLHAFVNSRFIGTQFGINGKYDFVFEKNVKLRPGTNDISLVSVTVGLQNFGDDIKDVPIGIHGGPVQLIDYAANITKDLSTNEWIYKVGIHGIKQQLNKVHTRHQHNWRSEALPTNRPFVWYKTTFPSPLGTDPVVVDLLGLGKGEAWVNGKSIGRYWPSITAPKDGCPYKCDYNQSYDGGKCVTNCGKSTQRYYHIPREFLDDRENVLVLFEEFGGTPDDVTVQTVTVGTVCAHAYDNNNLQLSCQGGRVFTDIRFASFGNPEGTCGSFKKGTCEAPWALSYIQNNCLGRESCVIPVSEYYLGPTGCHSSEYRLAVEAVC